MNEKTISIMQKHGYLQKEEDREEAIKYNNEMLEKFKQFLESEYENKREIQDIFSGLGFYLDFNYNSGQVLKFNDMDEEHFNYVLFNRCIRKAIGMEEKDYMRIMDSLGVFGKFLEQENIENAELFKKVSKQKDKMKKRLKKYEKLQRLVGEGGISEQQYGKRVGQLFGYGYFE